LTIDRDQISVTVTGYYSCANRAQRGSDAFERRPHIYRLRRIFAGIRNLQVEGLVPRRSEFRVEATRIDR